MTKKSAGVRKTTATGSKSKRERSGENKRRAKSSATPAAAAATSGGDGRKKRPDASEVHRGVAALLVHHGKTSAEQLFAESEVSAVRVCVHAAGRVLRACVLLLLVALAAVALLSRGEWRV